MSLSVSLRRIIGVGSALTGLAIAAGLTLAALEFGPQGVAPELLIGGSAVLASAVAGTLYRSATKLLDRLLDDHQTEHRRFQTAIDNISQGLCFFDGAQRLIFSNRRYAEMYRLAPEHIRPGTTLGEIVDERFKRGSGPDMTPAQYLDWRARIAVSSEPSDTLFALKDGRTFAIHHEPMPDGGWVATHEDITERRRAVAQIERMAHHDELTGLPNRVLFRQRLVSSLATGSETAPLAVLCIDLDRFKAVNDTLGHPVGDALLRLVSQRVGECLRHNDLVARLGGDEFAIIQTSGAQPGAARGLAQRLVRVLAVPFEIDGHQVMVGASVGLVLAPADGTDPDDLMKKADMALYAAKAAGRGTFAFFRPQMDEQAQRRRGLEIDLRSAIEKRELELHYQPIVGLGQRQVVGFEALLRWHHPVRGMVAPDIFIPLAEDTGLIDSIGEWVLNEAFAQASHWPPSIGIAVNLSPVQLKNGNLVAVVSGALQRSGLAANRVDLEITESVLLAENSINVATLHRLRGLGVRISLDDFGVGYSSLSYLRSFPFKKLKIDRSFIRDVVGNREAVAIVRAMTTLGKSLDMLITAEGIETEEQYACVRELGCDEAQGYLLSAPRPAAEIETMLRPERRLTLVAASRF
ncbi:MAG: EAL domain-containing protein [Burkholderiaceae bacterium]